MFACRGCGHPGLKTVLDLGMMPLANSLLSDDADIEHEPKFPLELVLCAACGLAQITETVPPEQMFVEYLYFSSFSETMLRHARELVEKLASRGKLTDQSLVVELASNDGYLLQYFIQKHIPVLGIEPAANIAKAAWEEKRVPTISRFFGVNLAKELQKENRMADVVIAINVMAHVPDLNGFLEGIRLILKPSGVAVVEVPYLPDLIDHCEFDTIYHEHFFYFSLTALVGIFKKQGMTVTDVEHLPIHGGSLRIFAVPGLREDAIRPGVRQWMEKEKNLFRVIDGNLPQGLTEFSERVRLLKSSILKVVTKCRSEKKRVAAYGAAAKGAVLMNYCGLGKDRVEFVVDLNPAKQGKRMPGTHQPVFHPARLLETMPDFVLILPWNIADEIIHQTREYQSRGGRYIVPVPEVRII